MEGYKTHEQVTVGAARLQVRYMGEGGTPFQRDVCGKGNML